MLLNALLPIAIIISLGFVFARTPLGGATSWELVERLTYYLFFPALLIGRLASASVSVAELQQLALALGLALALATLLILLIRKIIAADDASMSSIYQGSIRFNTYIGLAVIDALFGDAGLRDAALCLLVYIPAVNILSVTALSFSHPDSGRRISMALGSILRNPLVLACAVGLFLSEGDWQLPELLTVLLDILSQPALPLGLLAVGAGIRLAGFGAQTGQLLTALLGKMFIFPALVLLSCILLALDDGLSSVLVLLTALPAPPSAYILARQLGGNSALMANIISLQTLAAFASIPLWMDIIARFL